MILITRPEQKLAKSVAAFRLAGISCSGVAPLTITSCEEELSRLAHHLATQPADYIIVTSAFAAQLLSALPLSALPSRWFAVGTSTAQVLEECGLYVAVPEQQNSEGLLALSQLNSANRRQIVIIKGQGGRTTLRDTLLLQQNHVEEFAVYQRLLLEKPIQTDNWQWPQITGIVATSGEMAEQLFRVYDTNMLRKQRWLTVSDRVAAQISASGATQVAVCSDASDNTLCAWIKDNWE